jgi:hypothetical protein
MGATTFSTYGLGKTAEFAFINAREHALYMNGHGGYTGTLAEKDSYVLFVLPPRCTVQKLLSLVDELEDFESLEYLREDLKYSRNKTDLRQREAYLKKEEKRQAAFWRKHANIAPLLRQIGPIYNDKWGPAVALEVSGVKAAEIKKQKGRAGTHDKVFVFCGWASC